MVVLAHKTASRKNILLYCACCVSKIKVYKGKKVFYKNSEYTEMVKHVKNIIFPKIYVQFTLLNFSAIKVRHCNTWLDPSATRSDINGSCID